VTHQNRDHVVSLTLRVVVSSCDFSVVILPDGQYKIYGPLWGGVEPAELTRGKLGYGFALPGIERACAEIIKAALNNK
jgi:hypothetical protein